MPNANKRRRSPSSEDRGNRRGRYDDYEDRSRDRHGHRDEYRRDKHDVCTLKVAQLTAKVRKQDLYDYFSDAAKVITIDLPIESRTGRHKGHGYVEVASVEDVNVCLMLNDAVPPFQKYAITVAPSESFLKSRGPSSSTHIIAGSAQSIGRPSHTDATPSCARLFLGKLPLCINESVLMPVLQFYGALTSMRMGERDGHRHAFASYEYDTATTSAAAALQGFKLAGQTIQAELLSPENEVTDDELARRGAMALAGAVVGAQSVFVELGGVQSSPKAKQSASRYESGLEELLREACREGDAEAVYYKLDTQNNCVLWEFTDVGAAERAVEALHGRWLGGTRMRCQYLEELQFHERI